MSCFWWASSHRNKQIPLSLVMLKFVWPVPMQPGLPVWGDTCNLPAVIMWENTAGLGPSGANCVTEHCSFSFLPIIVLTCFPAKFTSFSYQFQREKNFKLAILSRFTKPHIKVKHQGIIKLGKLGISHSLNAETLYSQQHFLGEKISES